MQSKRKEKPRSFFMLLVQLFIAALIMLIFGSYVWLIQLKYDVTAKETQWTGRIWLPIFYALAVAAAGFTYDCAKSILFLKETTFKQFMAHVREAIIYIILIVVTMMAAFYLLNLPNPGARFFGQVIYLVGLVTEWYAVQSIGNAVDVVAKGEQ